MSSSPAAPAKRRARAVAVVDCKSWLEAYVVDELVCVEYHEPRREHSVGMVDRPRSSAGTLPELLLVIRRALDGKPGADAGELNRRLAGAIAAELEPGR